MNKYLNLYLCHMCMWSSSYILCGGWIPNKFKKKWWISW